MAIIQKLFSKFTHHIKHIFQTSVNYYTLLDQIFTVTGLFKEAQVWGTNMTHLHYRIYYPTDALDSKDISFTEISKELNTGRRERSSRKVNALCGSLECSRLNEDEENEASYASRVLSFVVCDV